METQTNGKSLYLPGVALSEKEVQDLALFLQKHHQQKKENSAAEKKEKLHQEIFQAPLVSGTDLESLTEGLSWEAERLKANDLYRQEVAKLGELFLQTETAWTHGDFFPGNWLKTSQGIQVQASECSHLGLAAFDWGMMLAHFILAAQPQANFQVLWSSYPLEEWELGLQLAGVEVMRRLMGPDQLPLEANLEQKATWLELSYYLVVDPASSKEEFF